jgi:crossover junction endodeoxyribonuclease RuvC
MIRPLRVVALDLSTAATGIAATHASTGEPSLWATVLDTSKRPLHTQTDIIDVAVRRACGFGSGNRPLGGGRVDLVVIEGTFSRQSGSDYPLHHVRAVVTQWLSRQRIAYATVQPTTLKVWATGSGSTRGATKVTKAQVVEAIIARYGKFLNIPADDNACDAVALLTLALDAYGQPLGDTPDTHRRAHDEIRWPELRAVS